MAVDFKNNEAAVQAQFAVNMERALTAMANVGLEMVIDQMNTGYGKPIYKTGDLQRSIAFDIDVADKSVTWGSNLVYAPYVHDGTSKMAGRPFLKDGLLNNKKMLQELAEQELGKDF